MPKVMSDIVKGIEGRFRHRHRFLDLPIDDDVALGGAGASTEIEEVGVENAQDVYTFLTQSARNCGRTLAPEEIVARTNALDLDLRPAQIHLQHGKNPWSRRPHDPSQRNAGHHGV